MQAVADDTERLSWCHRRQAQPKATDFLHSDFSEAEKHGAALIARQPTVCAKGKSWSTSASAEAGLCQYRTCGPNS